MVSRKITFFLFLFFLYALPFLHAQVRYKHFTTAEGLSQNCIYAIFQDKDGFLWFGTQEGLNRFDGISFKAFKHNNDDTTSISDDYILSISEDRNGDLWIGTRNGANRFDKTTETFQRFFFPELFALKYHQSISRIEADSHNNIFMGLPNGVYKFSPFDNYRSKQRVFTLPGVENYNSLLIDPLDNLLIAAQSNFFQLNASLQKSEFPYPAKLEIQMLRLRKNKIWFAANNSLWTFDLTSKKIEQFILHSLTQKNITALYVDRTQRIWIGSNNEIILLEEISPAQYRETKLARNKDDSQNINDERVISIFEDRSGLTWFGTLFHGLYMYDPLQTQFKTIDESILKINPPVWSVCEDSIKIIWFATSKGLLKGIRKDTARPITSYRSIDEAFASIEKIPQKELAGHISAVIEDNEKQLWIGTGANGVFRFNVEKNSLQHFARSLNDTTLLAGNAVLCIRKSSQGDIWIGTTTGFTVISSKHKKSKNFLLTSFHPSAGNYVMNFFEDSKGGMWILTSNGVFRYDLQNNSMEFFSHSDERRQSLSYNITTAGIEDASKNIWIATFGGGLNLLNKKNNSFTHFSTVNGLPNNVIYGILCDKKRNLWLSTNEGLSRFNIDTKTFTNFSIEEGLEFNEFAINAYMQNKNGEMFFGGVGGIVAFNPDRLIENRFVPPVVINDLKINYKHVGKNRLTAVKGTLAAPQEIHLSYLEKTVTLEFAALNFRDAIKNKYKYKLEGFDDNWIVPESNLRVAHYTSLPSGNFTFVVKAANNSGVWNETGLRIKIIVSPPFWLAWWFISILSALVLGTVFYSVRFFAQRKLRRQLRELEMQNKIQQERERISRDLHDNVGSQLVNIISGLDIAGRFSETSKEKAQSLLVSLREDARSSMAQLRQTIWALKTNEMTIEQFCDDLEINTRKQFQYHDEALLHCTKNIYSAFSLSPIQIVNLFRITQEAITNSLKYSNARHVFLSLEEEPSALKISIHDDGNGFQNKDCDLLTGNGLLNMERRVKELGGTFTCTSSGGVLIEIKIPKHFFDGAVENNKPPA